MSALGPSTILVVDDERNIADTLADILARFGFQVLKAYDAEQALEIALTTPPTLLLTDVLLPKKSGIQLAIELTTQRPTCKVLLVSGQTETGVLLDEAKASGYEFDVLPKPLHPLELLDHITKKLSESCE